MSALLDHRGPDGRGLWRRDAGDVVLAHRRLAIIDLSDDGAQPMQSSDGRFVLTFNGEIYNYLELKRELTTCGHQFRTASDTEVLLHAISQWGMHGALTRVTGMFGLALWDEQNQVLSLARDRVGKKPLYYGSTPGGFYFSSEIKALRTVPRMDTSTREEAVWHYLSLTYVPSPLTIYNGIHEVPSGTILTLARSSEPHIVRYWELPGAVRTEAVSFDEAVEAVDNILNQSVEWRLRADVPVGVFLSGGIDSGLLTAMAAGQSAHPVSTFTVGFEGASGFDETGLAQQVANRYGTSHSVVPLKPDLNDLLPKVVAAYDEPFGDPSAVPTFAVSQAAARTMKVVLNGEGADELFGGYRRHMASRYGAILSPALGLLPRKAWKSIWKMIPTPKGFRTPYAFAYRFLRGFTEAPSTRYLKWTSDTFTDEDKSGQMAFSGSPQPTGLMLDHMMSGFEGLDPLKYFMATDFRIGMQDCLLVKIDIATMAHGLEARSPFLDHRLVEYTASLPGNVLLPGNTSKAILRQLAKRYLPNDLVTAPKRGFELPVTRWMKDDLFEMTRDVCLDRNGVVSSIVPRAHLMALLETDAPVGQERRAKQLWTLLMLGLWDASNG